MDHPFHEMNYILYLFVIQCLKNTKKAVSSLNDTANIFII